MSEKTTEQRVLACIAEVRGGNEGYTSNSSLIDDIGFDSLDIMELVMTIEEEFAIQLNDDEINKALIVSDYVKLVEQRLGK